MKKYIKSIFAICILATLLLGQTSCNDMLDQDPQGKWTGDDEESAFETEVFAIYAKMRSFNVSSGTPALAIHSFRSEDAEKGSILSDGSKHSLMYDDFMYDTNNDMIGGYWTGNFEMVHNANSVITDITAVQNTNPNSVSRLDTVIKGEAHFFRAFAYFNLVRAFGEVPYIDFKLSKAEDANVPKVSKDTIYKLIDQDLAMAERYLPKAWDSKFVGRLTWGAARSLHARTFMMRNNWDSLYVASTDVINSGIYNLNTPFSQLFRETGENCSESILEIQCTATKSLPGDNKIGSEFARAQGVRGSGQWDLGWGWNTPSQLLADAFEPGDPRKDETLLYFYREGESAASIQANKPYGEKPMAVVGVLNKYYNKKAYTDPELRAKYNKFGFWYNIRLIRYGDVVLMAAESANEKGNVADAQTYLEMIRARARGNNNSILPKVNLANQALLRDAIHHERRVELAMEFDRFYDLVRWGTTHTALVINAGKNYQPRHALLPIPQVEIDKSNGILIQNSDY